MKPILFSLLLLTQAFAEQQVTLAWDASETPGVAGYLVYVSEVGSKTVTRINAGPNLRATIPDLVEGTQYSFWVTAYVLNAHNKRVESDPSVKLNYIIPATPWTGAPHLRPPSFMTNGLVKIVVYGPVKGWCVLATDALGSPMQPIGTLSETLPGVCVFYEPTRQARYYTAAP